MRFEIFRFPSVSSTNDVAISLIKKEKKNFRMRLCRNTNKRKRNLREKMDFK